MLGKCELGAFGQNFRTTQLTTVIEEVSFVSALPSIMLGIQFLLTFAVVN